MLIRHVREAPGSSQSCSSRNRGTNTDTAQDAIILTTVIITTVTIEKSLVVIASIARTTHTPAAHTIRNQSAQDFLCIEHAPHVCRSADRFASAESTAVQVAPGGFFRYGGAVITSTAIERADVVVVGSGVIGASVAYHLARRGAGSILVLDRESAPGHGSTGRATGGYRAQYSTEINIRLSLLARDALRRFSDETGVDPGYRPVGYLWIASSPEEFDDLVQAHALQKKAGLGEATLLDPGAVAQKNPFVRQHGVVGGAFCQTDGFIRPLEILRGYVEAAKRLGVRFAMNTAVSGIEKATDGRIRAVRTEQGPIIETHAVVDAGGAWARSIASLAGVDLPVVPLRRQVALTEPCPRLPDDMPLTIFMKDGFHLRVRDGRVMLLWPTPGNADDPYNTDVDPVWLERIAQMAAERIPCLQDVRVEPALSWAGLYEMSPDKHAILGPAPGCPNLYLVNGSSGHGVMHSPALGKLLAEIIVDGRASSLDTFPLRPSRFAEGDLIVASDRL